ncbi:hypothetical protein F5X68DRAFT_233223 [Plectosphaerella plurivora]|uniref:CBM-cenC domain-containing protein n=1 Tax=Plectosphaerella plurivora TaxID=936078 RepID=A0A9P8VAX2_9PEZI|nr:hypothetical protein F5X68DRAFT_233223 [Plectosphaerella plurivora]
MSTSRFLAGVVLVAGAAASPHDIFAREKACNRDNLLRCVVDTRYSAQASAFCAELTPFTTTVATVTATDTVTETLDLVVQTDVVVLHSTTTVYTATVPETIITITAPYGSAPTVVKRNASDGPSQPPKCLTNVATPYPASRITSACSCIDVPASTISATFTAGTVTATETVTNELIATTTVTDWETASTQLVSGTSTISVPHPTLINMDFESGTTEGWGQRWGHPNFLYDVVSIAGPSGNPNNKALRIHNIGYLGDSSWITTQPLIFESGATYRIAFVGKSTIAGAISRLSIYVRGRGNVVTSQNYYRLGGGMPLPNGWTQYSYDFLIPASKGGPAEILFGVERFQSTVSHYLDDFVIARL